MNPPERLDLQRLAEQVDTVDLVSRATDTAHRLKRNTRVGIAGLAVILVAGGASLGITALPDGRSDHHVAPAATFDGGTVILADNGDGNVSANVSKPRVSTWRPGEEPIEVLSDEEVLDGSLRSSPDGQYLSFIDGDGDLRIRNLYNGDSVDPPTDVPGSTDVPMTPGDDGTLDVYSPPTWARDSHRLLVMDPRTGDEGFVDVTTGDYTEWATPTAGQYNTLTADDEGTETLYSLVDTGSDGLALSASTGDSATSIHTGPLPGTDRYLAGIAGVNDNGSQVCAFTSDVPVSVMSWTRGQCDTLLDITDGTVTKARQLYADDVTQPSVYAGSERVDLDPGKSELRLVDPDGAVSDTEKLPIEGDLSIIAYIR